MTSCIFLPFTIIVMSIYGVSLFVLMLYGIHRYWIIYLYSCYYKKGKIPHGVNGWNTFSPFLDLQKLPPVTIQLPLYNEKYVAARLIESICALDYPKDKLQVQILDDSTDETTAIVADVSRRLGAQGFNIEHVRRGSRTGYKAGALAYGLKSSTGDFIAIFDADFLPPHDFLKATLPYFSNNQVGMVQTRWGHINGGYSLLTRLQSIFLDGHFMLEHTARYKSGAFFNFNGTGGVWRKRAIEEAGGWSAQTLTEDLDLSYRAQLAGWKFIYLPNFVCPAELPVDIHSFYSQQRRWTKGAIQVARLQLKKLWKAPIPLHTKVESTVHLTGNIGYLLTVLVAILLLPSLLLRHYFHWVGFNVMEVIAFISTTVSIFSFYIYSQKEIYPDWKWRIRDVPFLMSFGIGMCLSNARAVLEGIFGASSEFIRTPKYNIQAKGDSWTKKEYANGRMRNGTAHLVFSAYSALTLLVACVTHNWGSIPFVFIFALGFFHLSILSILHSHPRN